MALRESASILTYSSRGGNTQGSDMNGNSDKRHISTPDNEPELDLGNSEGIAPPSETAKSLMNAGGYVDSAGIPEKDPIANELAAACKAGLRTSHVDGLNRSVPQQRTWPK